MYHDGVQHLAARQLWNIPTPTSVATAAHCTPFILPSNGIIQISDSSAITLTADVVFQPECTGVDNGDSFPVGYLKDPFYASTIPMVYVIAAATVIAWILVIMLMITPRTSFFGLPNTAPAFSNGHGIIGGASGGDNWGLAGGGGSRPWLQKLATLFVAIALTIATADTLEVAQTQHYAGISDAGALRREVLGSLEIRITRVVSDIFVWLAQVQTLIRLFPRHKEKVLIKWIGFVLIILDTVFSCLNSFLPGISDYQRGRRFVDAIPALSYLFELALGLLYAAWVLYYTMAKRRYAYYSPKMHSISLIALLSLVALLTPVVFFVTDVSNQEVAGWGDYFRWVGAAAASVVVWEWVERIEALERDDKKDGILGREVFDGDEMLDISNDENNWSQSRNLSRSFRRRGHDSHGGNQSSRAEKGLHSVTNRFRSRHQQSPQHFPLGRAHSSSEPNSSSHDQSQLRDRTITFDDESALGKARNTGLLGGPTPPPPIASPIDRADTTSAASTVYVVRYDQVADVPEPIRRMVPQQRSNVVNTGRPNRNTSQIHKKDTVESDEATRPDHNRASGRWHGVSNPFKRKRTSPPQEVQRARAANPELQQRAPTPAHSFSRWDVKNRIGAFAAETGDMFRERSASKKQQADLPLTVVPARPRDGGRVWTPDEVAPIIMTAESTQPSSEEPPNSGGSTSETLVADERQDLPTAEVNRIAPRPSTINTPAVVRNTPPRADDISPTPGSRGNGRIIVAAPPRRSPAARILNSARPNDSNSLVSAGPSSQRSTPASQQRQDI